MSKYKQSFGKLSRVSNRPRHTLRTKVHQEVRQMQTSTVHPDRVDLPPIQEALYEAKRARKTCIKRLKAEKPATRCAGSTHLGTV